MLTWSFVTAAMYKDGMRKMAALQAQVNKLQDEVEVWRMGYNNKG